MSPFMDVKQCAEYLNLKPTTLYKWSRTKRIPSRKLGGRLMFHKGDIDEWTKRDAKESIESELSPFEAARARIRSLTNQPTEPRHKLQKGA
jgi:excisionase family DNA binding protein